MLERIKTVLLIVLVAISIWLSWLIWEGLPLPAAPSSSPPLGGTFWGPSIDPVELMIPARIIVHLGEGRHSILYPNDVAFDQTWHLVLDMLQQLGGRRSEDLKLKTAELHEWQETQESPGLELVFDFPADGELWGYVLDYSEGLDFNRGIKRILLQAQPTPVLLLASEDGDTCARLKFAGHNENLQALLEQLSSSNLPDYIELEDIPVTPFGIYIPKQDLSYPLLRTKVENIDPKVAAGSFFADLSLTRCINERDGATIYSDGRRGVRVWPEGRVEYNAPEVLYGVHLPLTQALNRVVRFVTQHGGWFPNVRLAQAEEITAASGEFYRLAFRQYEFGLPVFSPQIELDLSDRGVASYRREILVSERQVGSDSLSVTELKNNLISLAAEGKSVSDVYPGYLIEHKDVAGGLLYPVWMVEMKDGRLKVLDVVSGGDSK